MLAPGVERQATPQRRLRESTDPSLVGSGVSLSSCEGQVDQREGRRMVTKGKQSALPKLLAEEREVG